MKNAHKLRFLISTTLSNVNQWMGFWVKTREQSPSHWKRWQNEVESRWRFGAHLPFRLDMPSPHPHVSRSIQFSLGINAPVSLSPLLSYEQGPKRVLLCVCGSHYRGGLSFPWQRCADSLGGADCSSGNDSRTHSIKLTISFNVGRGFFPSKHD